jgi:hypothetical protein
MHKVMFSKFSKVGTTSVLSSKGADFDLAVGVSEVQCATGNFMDRVIRSCR